MAASHLAPSALVWYILKSCRKKEKENTTPFGVNLMRSQVLYQAAHGLIHV